MRKKLCLTCAQALQKRADIRYTGKRTRMDITAALFRCSTGKQQILGYGSFSCINVSKNS